MKINVTILRRSGSKADFKSVFFDVLASEMEDFVSFNYLELSDFHQDTSVGTS